MRRYVPLAAALALTAALAATLALTATPAAAQDAAPPPADPAAIREPLSGGFLRAGDRLSIRVWRQPEFSGDFFVTEQGIIGHPIFRSIGRVAGRDVEEVQPLIEDFLRQYEQEPNVVVEPFFRVAVGGQVRQPDVHYLRPGTTVAQAVSLAGGVTERGRTDDITLRRDGRDYDLDLSDPSLASRNWVVYSGDEIIVWRKVSVFREYILPAVGFVGSIAAIYNIFSR